MTVEILCYISLLLYLISCQQKVGRVAFLPTLPNYRAHLQSQLLAKEFCQKYLNFLQNAATDTLKVPTEVQLNGRSTKQKTTTVQIQRRCTERDMPYEETICQVSRPNWQG